MNCPPCASNKVVKNGHRNGKQSYLCRDCRRQFRDNLQLGYRAEVKALCVSQLLLESFSIGQRRRIPSTLRRGIATQGLRRIEPAELAFQHPAARDWAGDRSLHGGAGTEHQSGGDEAQRIERASDPHHKSLITS
jgi:hypothetical protein